MDHLSCFAGGMFALGSGAGVTSLEKEYLTAAKKITKACYKMYKGTSQGLSQIQDDGLPFLFDCLSALPPVTTVTTTYSTRALFGPITLSAPLGPITLPNPPYSTPILKTDPFRSQPKTRQPGSRPKQSGSGEAPRTSRAGRTSSDPRLLSRYFTCTEKQATRCTGIGLGRFSPRWRRCGAFPITTFRLCDCPYDETDTFGVNRIRRTKPKPGGAGLKTSRKTRRKKVRVGACTKSQCLPVLIQD